MRMFSVGSINGTNNTCRFRTESFLRMEGKVNVISTTADQSLYNYYRIKNKLDHELLDKDYEKSFCYLKISRCFL